MLVIFMLSNALLLPPHAVLHIVMAAQNALYLDIK